MDVVREEMPIVAVKEEDAVDSEKWRKLICCGDFLKYLSKAESSEDDNILAFGGLRTQILVSV